MTYCVTLEQNLSNYIKVNNVTGSLLLIFFMMLLENAHVYGLKKMHIAVKQVLDYTAKFHTRLSSSLIGLGEVCFSSAAHDFYRFMASGKKKINVCSLKVGPSLRGNTITVDK